MSDNRGYYFNGLKAWRAKLERERVLCVARLQRMREMNHPDANDQALILRHIEQMVGVIDNAHRVAEALP